jgi:uncharacterized protein with FMN-binding domain
MSFGGESEQNGMKKRGKALVLTLSMIVFVFIGLFLWMMNTAREQLASITYENVDMAQVTDGMHYGETDAGLVSVKVAVRVENHSIQDISILEHQNGMGSAAESIVQAMIRKNHYTVDAVSGATLSSEAIKSAVSKALHAGQTK